MLSAAWRGKLFRLLLDLGLLLFKRELVRHFDIATDKLLSKAQLFFICLGRHPHHARRLLVLHVIDVVVLLRGARYLAQWGQ